MNPRPALPEPGSNRYHKTNGAEAPEIEETNVKLPLSEMAEYYNEPLITHKQETKKFNPNESKTPDEQQNKGSYKPDSDSILSPNNPNGSDIPSREAVQNANEIPGVDLSDPFEIPMSGLLISIGHVKERKTNFLFDTGCMRNYISSELCQKQIPGIGKERTTSLLWPIRQCRKSAKLLDLSPLAWVLSPEVRRNSG